MFETRTSTVPITKEMVKAAYRKVKVNDGAAGVDKESPEVFQEDLLNNLYVLWNRLSSGSYFPKPLRSVSIPKSNGKKRTLGIPTVRALFDLEEENTIYAEQGVVAFRQYQKDRENDVLKHGTGFHIVNALLNLNKFATGSQRLVEVIVMSKNSPETGIRVLNSIRHYNLDITRSAFTGGEALYDYMEAFDVDLFLSKDENDVQKIIDSGSAAAALIYEPPHGYTPETTTVRIAFDADAVLFSDESETIYKKHGMAAFYKNESTNEKVPLKEGPHAKLLKMLSAIQKKMSMGVELSPLRIAIVTARNSPSHIRVLETLHDWDVYVDEAFFLGGISKDKVLKAFKAHIFFDDQEAHLDTARVVVPVAKVPYKSTSVLFSKKATLTKSSPEIIALREIVKIKEGIA